MSELTPAQLAAINPAYWAGTSNIQLQTGPFSFEKHEYQIEPMQSEFKRVCYRKGTQGGWSELEVLKSLHGMIHRRYPHGVLYLFPTTDNVHEFSKSRFNPLIAANHQAIGRFVKENRKGTDTTSMKKIGTAFLYLRGARLSQRIGAGDGEKESGQLRGIPVDRVVFDELDLMDEDVIEKAKGRMGSSQIKEEVYISNPTIPDHGIDSIFQKSDQRYLWRKCDCGGWTCAERSFPDCVKEDKEGNGYIACTKCGKPVGYKTCRWVPDCKENTDTMRGYQWSQLSSPFNDPMDILRDFQEPPNGNIGDVYRLRLGLPYVAAEDRLAEGDVYACCNNDVMPMSSGGPCAMGVDVGKIKHVVVGIRTDNEKFEVLRAVRLSSWNDIHDLAKRFNVKSAVIDIRPYEDEARNFQKQEPYPIFLCEYSESPLQEVVWDNKNGVVRAYRTGIFDRSHRLFSDKQVVIPRKGTEIEVFCKQVCGAAKVLETSERTGTSVYRYRKCGADGDHFRNAMNYFYLAASGCRIARVGKPDRRPTVAMNEYARI